MEMKFKVGMAGFVREEKSNSMDMTLYRILTIMHV